ncbi:uncharacterized protein LOC142317867 [Lycorma delicatula]|uniref:uncharacterized protein LOC142317867 n=1 Tax=Lycorma delicatula TaxID=130591 RepID=UPI003F510C74
MCVTCVAEKISDVLQKGQHFVQQDLVSEIKKLMAEVQVLPDLDKVNISRESRGLLDKLTFLTGLHFGSIFQGTGTVAATQSLSLLGRFINSALSLSYGSSSSVIPAAVPVLPVADDIPHDSQHENNNDDDNNEDNRTKYPVPLHFIADHNRRVHEINNKLQNQTYGTYRQGRINRT